MGKFGGDYRGEVGGKKWRAGAQKRQYISEFLKRAKVEEKLLWRAYIGINSPTIFRTVPSPTPYGLLFPKIGVCNPTQNFK